MYFKFRSCWGWYTQRTQDLTLVLSLLAMEADALLSVPNLSLWFLLACVYFCSTSEARWVLITYVPYVPTCLLSICSFGCL